MTDEYFWTVILAALGVAAILFGYALIQIRERQRQNRELEAEQRPSRTTLTPAE